MADPFVYLQMTIFQLVMNQKRFWPKIRFQLCESEIKDIFYPKNLQNLNVPVF